MSEINDNASIEDKALAFIQAEIAKSTTGNRKRIIEKVILAILGSIPWVGGFISAAASYKFEESGVNQNNLQTQWLREHAKKIEQLKNTLSEIASRFESLGENIDERIESEDYLTIVRKSFRVWDQSDTDEKRKYIANLVTNCAASKITTDDVIRLFIDWLQTYHEAHFAIVREIYQNPESTRFSIWTNIRGIIPRENSAEADLYRLLIRDLSTGGVIRQLRDTDEHGRFLKKPTQRRTNARSRTTESAFEDTKPYVLTELGQQFVHYTITELTPRIESDQQ
jgi:hypothetical protein